VKATRAASTDADHSGALRALKRAAVAALLLAKQTNTPYYVFKNGRVVDLNAPRSRRRGTRRR
jgi:hypothetical protein